MQTTVDLARRRLLRLLPRGAGDLALQLLLFIAADLAYESVRGLVDGRAQVAFTHAQAVVGLEQSLGLFFEPGLQQAALAHTWLIEAASWLYINSHFVVTTVFLVWLYFARNGSFYFVRNMFVVAMGMALVGYFLFPTAPPRMLGEYGFTDTVAAISGIDQDSSLRSFINPYAAIPSMHVGFALMIALPAVRLVRRTAFRVLWLLYPLLVTAVVLVTANHFWIDALIGALVAAAAAVTAQAVLAPAHRRWSWQAAENTALS